MKRLLPLMLLLCFLCQVNVAAQSSGAASQKARLEKEIFQLENSLKENSKKKNSALSSLSIIRKQLINRKKLLEQSERELKAINAKISSLQAEIKKNQARLDTLSKYYSKLVLNAYKNRDSRVWYMYILASENIGEGLHRYNWFKSIAARMNAEGERITALRKEQEARKADLAELQKTAAAAKNGRQAEMNKLKKKEADNSAVIKTLQRDKTRYQKQLATKRRQVEDLNRQISRMVSSSSQKSKKPVDVKLSNEFSSNKGKLPWPVAGPVIEDFGQHYHPVYKSVKLPFNNGITISIKGGSAVKAVFDGDVRQVIVMPGYNKCVLIQHGAYFTFYCKLGNVSVKAKDKVKTGQTIGTVDTGGEDQFHFQLWEGRTPEDPQVWLR